MNKINWVDGRYTTPQDFNAMQTEPEAHIEGLGRRLPAAVVDGCVPVGAGAGVTIGAGVAWDAAGRRIVIPVGGAAVDMTGIDRPAAGQFRWLTWFATYQRINRGTIRDKAGIDRPAHIDDGYSVGVRAGSAFAQSSIDDARARQVATRPAAPAGAAVLGYGILDHNTEYGTLFTADTLFRREVPRPMTPLAIHATGLGRDLLSPLAPILPRPRDYAIGTGAVWLGGRNPRGPYPLYLARRAGRILEAYYGWSGGVQWISATMVTLYALFDRVVSYGPAKYPPPATGGW